MNEEKITIEKVCSFYINQWHLTTMVLPNIYKEINENETIITFLQIGIKENIEEILKKMNLKDKDKKQIQNIKWTSTEIIKYENVKKEIEKIKNKKVIILVNGKKEYIEMVNKNINKVIKEIKGKGRITVINCYEITEFDNIGEITKIHDYILNTSGIQKITEVFTENEAKNA